MQIIDDECYNNYFYSKFFGHEDTANKIYQQMSTYLNPNQPLDFANVIK